VRGGPFVYEETPSEQGVLSEYVRRHPDSIRSMHPLFSIAAIGPKARDICCTPARSAFGFGSPYQKLVEFDALHVFLGVDVKKAAIVRYFEQVYGVPYCYTKEWTMPVWRDGKRKDDRFFGLVRYLNAGVDHDCDRLTCDLTEQGFVKTAKIGTSHVHAVRSLPMEKVALTGLSADPFYFLRKPPTQEPWKRTMLAD